MSVPRSRSRTHLAATSFVALTSLSVVGCVTDTATAAATGTMRADGYALFAVENTRQQRNDITVTIDEADPGATYVLLYSSRAPTNVGWFLFDPNTKSRCGGDTGPHCEVPGFGHMVDVVTVPEAATNTPSSVTLRDDRCGCDADHPRSSWTGHWAVMRVERTGRMNRVRFEVEALKVKDYASTPDVEQLQ